MIFKNSNFLKKSIDNNFYFVILNSSNKLSFTNKEDILLKNSKNVVLVDGGANLYKNYIDEKKLSLNNNLHIIGDFDSL